MLNTNPFTVIHLIRPSWLSKERGHQQPFPSTEVTYV